MLVLVLVLQLSDQRPSLSNSKSNIQGRHQRSKNDMIIGKPLSEEEFQLSLHIGNKYINLKKNDQINYFSLC